MLCKAFREGKIVKIRKGDKILDEITSFYYENGYKVSLWLHQGSIIAELDNVPDETNYSRVLTVFDNKVIITRMKRNRINYILKHCFNTPVTYHLKYSEFNGILLYGYFKIGSKTYEADSIKILFDENYNVIDVKVDESKRVIYAMNNRKVKYLVKLAKQLSDNIYEIDRTLRSDYPQYFYIKNALSSMFRFIYITGLIYDKLYAKYEHDHEMIKDRLNTMLKETNTILEDVKRFYAEKTLFPE